MKKLFLIIALLFLASKGFCAVTTGTFGDQNSSKNYRMAVNSDGTITYASDTSIALPYSDVTSSTVAQTLATTDSGRIIIDEGIGTTGGHSFTLPRAAPGLVFTIVTAKKTFTTIDTVDASDTIDYSISGTYLSAGDSILSTGQAGDSVTLCSSVANHWGICAMKAAWTDNN